MSQRSAPVQQLQQIIPRVSESLIKSRRLERTVDLALNLLPTALIFGVLLLCRQFETHSRRAASNFTEKRHREITRGPRTQFRELRSPPSVPREFSLMLDNVPGMISKGKLSGVYVWSTARFDGVLIRVAWRISQDCEAKCDAFLE